MSGIVKGMHIRDEPVRRFGEVQSSVRTGRIRDCCVVGFKGPLFAFFLVVLFLGSVALPSLVRPAAIPNPSIADTAPPPSAVEAGIRDGYGKLPLSFEANQGQTDREVSFLARGRGYGLFLTPTESVLVLRKPNAASPAVVRIKLVGRTRGRWRARTRARRARRAGASCAAPRPPTVSPSRASRSV